jgi:hypothetical protein
LSEEPGGVALGPVQLLVVGFDRHDFDGEVLAEFERLRESSVVRVIDLLIVHKDADGVVQRVQHPDLAPDEAEGAGVVVETLIGLSPAGEEGSAGGAADGGPLAANEDFWSLDGAIPSDSTAVIALVEHRWASATRDAIRAAGGVAVADAWIHPSDLVAAGLADSSAGSVKR